MSKLTEKIEQYAIEIIQGRNKTIWDRLFRLFLYTISHFYRLAVLTRIALYEKGICHRQNLGCFVVSVGNLTTGGTGKTPVVELLARTLCQHGRKVAILSRGYRSRSRTFKEKLLSFLRHEKALPPKVVSDGTQLTAGMTSWEAGDEPFMLARNLVGTQEQPGVAVLVDKNRINSGRYAIQHFKTDTLLLDDGFQYLPLRPRINIVLVDTTRPFHNHEVLPIGLLREPIENISKADYIFLTKCKRGRDFTRLRENFLRKHNKRAPIIECNHEPCHLTNLDGSGNFPLDTLKGKKIASLCGIAVPRSFEDYLEQLGATIVYRKNYVDHHRYTVAEMEHFAKRAHDCGAELYITTEKDAVRIPPFATNAPFLYLRVEIVILKGQEEFEKCITNICMN